MKLSCETAIAIAVVGYPCEHEGKAAKADTAENECENEGGGEDDGETRHGSEHGRLLHQRAGRSSR